MAETDPAVLTGFGARLRDAVSDALTYWEPRRIVYNAVLVTVVLAYFVMNWPYSRGVVSLEGGLFVFILAVLANVCYCAAYLGDVFVQVSGLRQTWHEAVGLVSCRHGLRGCHHSMVRDWVLHASARGLVETRAHEHRA